MDDHEAGAPGKRPDSEGAGDKRNQEPEQEYFWEGRPGEDFGPIAPPSSGSTPRERRRLATDDEPAPTPTRPIPVGRPSTDDGPGRPARATVQAAPPRRRWRPILTVLGALVLLAALATAVLVVISRQAAESRQSQETTIPVQTALPAGAAPSPGPASGTSTTAGGSPSPAPAANVSPTPLAIAPSPTPLPSRSPVATRASPVVAPAPVFVTPPGLRFPTSTPARLGTPTPPRTPPAIPSARPTSFLNRVWSEQVLHRVGDQASICGSAATGVSAQLTVIGPDRGVRTLGEFQPPAERVCYTLQLNEAGLYVLSLIVKDASGNEIDRQSGALSAGR